MPRTAPSPRAVAVPAAVLVALLALVAGLLLPAQARAGDEEVVAIEVLGNRADLLSDGNALVEVTVPTGDDAADLTVTAGDVDVTDAFAVRDNGRFMGRVEDLPLGETVLTASLPSGHGARITLTNHPRGGPVFSGPQIQPWTCLDGAADEQCNRETTYSLQYMPTTGTGFRDYDPDNPPSDVATTTTTEGEEVPYIVRLEEGAMNRDSYAIAVLFDPEAPDYEPWAPQRGFNGRMVIVHGQSCDTAYSQVEALDVMDDSFLSQGFAVASHVLNHSGHSCNVVLQAESMLMMKEHFVERYGELRWTIGTGCSGGALAQYWTANAYPGGIYQGITASCSFPDAGSSANQYVDYDLLREYFESAEAPSAGIVWTPDKQEAVYGHPNAINAVTFTEVIPSSGDPSRRQALAQVQGTLGGQRCPGLPNDQLYDAETNPDGVRCTLQQYNANALGTDPTTGWANRPFGNVGIQYGLSGLLDGTISPAEFVHLNANVGGWDPDYNVQDERYDADRAGLANIYRSGLNNTASNLDTTAIIDNRGPDPGAFHDTYRTYALRDRLIREHGHADNMLLWRGPVPLLGDPTYTDASVLAMDRWLAAVDADTSDLGLDEKIVRSRPEDVADRCTNGLGTDVDPAFCDTAIDVYTTPRIEAGAPLTDDVMRCRLMPVEDADHGDVEFTDAQLATLAEVFPDGVCDWSRPGLDETDTVPWLDYSDREGGVPMGPAPVSIPFGPGEEPVDPPAEPGPTGPRIQRHAGDNRIETAVAVSEASWTTASTVVIARADDFADALAGAPLAVATRGPLLLSGRDGVPEQTIGEITRLGASSVVLLGGEAALSPAVADQLVELGLDVRRLAGPTREATSIAIARELGTAEGAVLTSRDSFADALSVSALAAAEGLPILLVQPDDLGDAADVLTSGADVLVVGGTAAVGEEVVDAAEEIGGTVTRLAGPTRYATSRVIADAALARGLQADTVWLATGRDFADGLVAGAAAALDRGPLLLVDGIDMAGSPEAVAFLADHADEIVRVNIAGGRAAVSDVVLDVIDRMLTQ